MVPVHTDPVTKTPGAGGGSFVRKVDHFALRSALVDSVHHLLALGRIEALVRDLRTALAGRVVVCMTHDDAVERCDDTVVRFGSPAPAPVV